MSGLTKGRFITFEGGEGTGKSTQCRLLRDALNEPLAAKGKSLRLTREPGGTPGGEEIRALVLSGGSKRFTAMTELFLMMAARADHLDRLIRPALKAGDWVVSDRFFDSSRVYQGIAGAVGLETVDQLHRPLLGDTRPELTILLDLDPQSGLARRQEDGGANRFESKGQEFHQAVRRAFLDLAHAEPERFVVIDAGQDILDVAMQVRQAVESRLEI